MKLMVEDLAYLMSSTSVFLVRNGPLLTLLDLAGFAVSTGSACTAGTVDPSHVIQALYGKDSDKLKTAIRISLSEENTAEELQALAEKLNQIIGD